METTRRRPRSLQGLVRGVRRGLKVVQVQVRERMERRKKVSCGAGSSYPLADISFCFLVC
jgi:hypothetical protein